MPMLLLVVLIPAFGIATTDITNGNINSAADEWVANEAAAISKYGPIGTWDTKNVTIFYETFRVRLTSRSRPLAKVAGYA